MFEYKLIDKFNKTVKIISIENLLYLCSISDVPKECLIFVDCGSLGALRGTHQSSARSRVCSALSVPELARLPRLLMRKLCGPRSALLSTTTCRSQRSLPFRFPFSSTHQPTMMFPLCMVCIDHSSHAGRTLTVSRWP